eukprot:TRINITY_DN3328_c0_g2_i1.p1 TRINITY_DN3328_c0_g2~~TRINITY_DN3328_c0_g2_i1.p1  ORF type:complete len:314 (-),score=34.81 TRINITY_DN3328_c0_g2_i1:486-1295(-)
MAIDGVAPRAKMNQQRSRRFKSISEAQDAKEQKARAREELLKLGKELPEEKSSHFDSNVITPGTHFMKRVADGLRWYVSERLNSDAGWKDVKIILSDATVPGEGEHKIMEYIRLHRAQSDYEPNVTHCIYGADADLIMLAIATHEPHFYILREVVMQKGGRKCHVCGQEGHIAADCQGTAKKKVDENDTQSELVPYQLVQISILREYLEQDLRMSHNLNFKWDPERAMDDWVFLCFLSVTISFLIYQHYKSAKGPLVGLCGFTNGCSQV